VDEKSYRVLLDAQHRFPAAHAPGKASPDSSSARTRQAAQLRVETAYPHAPLMLAHDRRVLDAPLEERLQSRTSELLAWAKIMLPVINRSVRDTRAQLKTGHQDIRGFFSRATVATTDHTAAIPIAASPTRSDAPPWIFGSAFNAHEPGQPRFPPIFASTSQASLTAPPKQTYWISNNSNVHGLTNHRTGHRVILTTGPGRLFPTGLELTFSYYRFMCRTVPALTKLFRPIHVPIARRIEENPFSGIKLVYTDSHTIIRRLVIHFCLLLSGLCCYVLLLYLLVVYYSC
jgi:hypothetical protein